MQYKVKDKPCHDKGGKHTGRDADGQGDGKPLDRPGAILEQDQSGDKRSDMGVHDS
jgi:hypothetical protein